MVKEENETKGKAQFRGLSEFNIHLVFSLSTYQDRITSTYPVLNILSRCDGYTAEQESSSETSHSR